MFFVFNDTATTEIYTYGHTLSLPDALPISVAEADGAARRDVGRSLGVGVDARVPGGVQDTGIGREGAAAHAVVAALITDIGVAVVFTIHVDDFVALLVGVGRADRLGRDNQAVPVERIIDVIVRDLARKSSTE